MRLAGLGVTGGCPTSGVTPDQTTPDAGAARMLLLATILVASSISGFSFTSQVEGKAEKKKIYLAGTFPISGSEGWQGGQVIRSRMKNI